MASLKNVNRAMQLQSLSSRLLSVTAESGSVAGQVRLPLIKFPERVPLAEKCEYLFLLINSEDATILLANLSLQCS